MPYGHQVVLRLEEDIVLASAVAAQRKLASTVLSIARPFELLCFRWADTHGHLLTMDDRAGALELGRRVAIGLNLALQPGVPFLPCRVTPIKDVWHLENTFKYQMKQDEHHGFGHDLAREASNAPDLLLGLRTLGVRTTVPVRRHLTRLTRAGILETLGWRDPDRPDVELHGDLADAAAASIGAASLEGRARAVVEARRAAIEAARGTWTDAQVAERLSISTRAVRRMRRKESDPMLVRAIRQQLVLRADLPPIDVLE